VWFDAVLGGASKSCAVDHFRNTGGGEGEPTDLAAALQQARLSSS